MNNRFLAATHFHFLIDFRSDGLASMRLNAKTAATCQLGRYLRFICYNPLFYLIGSRILFHNQHLFRRHKG